MSKNEQFKDLTEEEQAIHLGEQGLKQPKRLSKIPTSKLPKGYNRLRVQFDITYKGHPGKLQTGEQLTEPDMSMSVQQLLERHSRTGDYGDQYSEPIFMSVPVPTINDLTDIETYRDQLSEQVINVNNFLKEEKAKQKQAKADKKAASSTEATDDHAKSAATGKEETPKETAAN